MRHMPTADLGLVGVEECPLCRREWDCLSIPRNTVNCIRDAWGSMSRHYGAGWGIRPAILERYRRNE